MSYANGTTFYNLPQTVGTDKRDWFDTNQAFADIDAALHAAATGQAADAVAISTLQTGLASANTDIAALQATTSTHTSQIATISNATSQNTSDIGDLRSDAEDMITAYNEGAAATSTRDYAIGDYFIYNDVLYKATAAIAIGDTIVPNTNCTATNVTTEISELNSDLRLKEIRSVTLATGDGTKTMATLLAEALTAFRQLTPLYNKFSVHHFYFPRNITSGTRMLPTSSNTPSQSFSSDNIVAFVSTVNSAGVTHYAINVGTNSTLYDSVHVGTDSTVTFDDLTSIVPQSINIGIYLNEYA